MRFNSTSRQSVTPARHRLFLGATIVALLVVTAAAIAAAATLSNGSASSPASYEAGVRAVLPTQAAANQVAALSILGRAQTAADAVPAADVPHAPTFTGLAGANVSLARNVHGVAGAEAWVVPGAGTVCLITDPGGATCQGEPTVLEGHMYLVGASAETPAYESVAGLVPNGVSRVSLVLEDGALAQLPVHENVYMASVKGRVSSIRFTGANGPVELTGVSTGIGSASAQPATATKTPPRHTKDAPLVTLRGTVPSK